jgi:hypothetical protein
MLFLLLHFEDIFLCIQDQTAHFVSLYVAVPYPEVFCDNNVRELASYQSYMPHTDKMEKQAFSLLQK